MPKLAINLTQLKTLFVSLFLFATGIAFAQSEDSALKMVQALRLGQNLGSMGYQVSKTTTTYQGLVAKLGAQKADEIIRAELAIAVPHHQTQWDKNLAKVWAPLMTASEFDSIATEKQKSPYAAKFSSLQNQAGAAMKTESEKLLTSVVTEALTSALQKSRDQK